jgi:hypothetical protein
MSITFDEFQAINKREKAPKIAALDPAKVDRVNIQKSADTKLVPVEESRQHGNVLEQIGEILELFQMQIVYIALLILNFPLAILSLHLSHAPVNTSVTFLFQNKDVLLSMILALRTFSSYFFGVEILCVLLTFRFATFTHAGYITDMITIIFQGYLENEEYGVVAVCFSVFRFWRLFRLFNTSITAEKNLQDAILMKLEISEEAYRKLTFEKENIALELLKEKEARVSVENMLTSYKEEVDTLNEALKIAAMDIAEVADADEDLLQSDDERTLEDDRDGVGEDGDTFSDAVASRYSKSTNKEVLMRAIIEDASNSRISNTAGSMSLSAFLIHEDGSFEQK